MASSLINKEMQMGEHVKPVVLRRPNSGWVWSAIGLLLLLASRCEGCGGHKPRRGVYVSQKDSSD